MEGRRGEGDSLMRVGERGGQKENKDQGGFFLTNREGREKERSQFQLGVEPFQESGDHTSLHQARYISGKYGTPAGRV